MGVVYRIPAYTDTLLPYFLKQYVYGKWGVETMYKYANSAREKRQVHHSNIIQTVKYKS